jgi:non-specific serine/threonine protein kinase
VEPLAVPPAEALPSLEKLQQYSAVQLFLERAQAVQPAFMLTPENAVAIAQVCRQLDGLPLALELAAGRLKLLDITQLAGRLDDRFRLLAGGRRLAPPRQQTLKATVDWSYDHLMEAERIVWRRLAVFAGSWSLAAAEVVCRGGEVAAEEVLERLAALVDHSLVQVEEVGGERRYRLLETLRQYGEERLQQAGEARAIRCRHRDWYLALAEQAEPQLRGAEQPLWLARLEQEHDSLRVALAWSLAEASELEAGLRMAGALWRFWTARSYLREGRYWLEALLAKGEGAATAIRAKAHVGAGHLAMAQGDEAAVHAHLQASLMLYRAMRDPQGCATASSILGQVALAPGEYAAARAHLEGSLVLAQTVGDT